MVPLGEPQDRVAQMLTGVQGILLPGSGFDVDPERYGEARILECGSSDPARTAVDELLLQDAFKLRKPILAICAGMQSLNVWLNGTLVQDLKTAVNHRPGREVVEAHAVRIGAGSRLARLLPNEVRLEMQVNSSHHQAVCAPGDRLVVTAVSPVDGVIEGMELDASDHFVLAVQWHPERSMHRARLRGASLPVLWRPPRVGARWGSSGWTAPMTDPILGVGARLTELLADTGLGMLDAEEARLFEIYFSLLIRWNARVNLTSVRSQEGILSRHFMESIACARALPAEVSTLLDFGSGGGFPGIPIAICRPEIAVTLAESQGKKAAFLQEAEGRSGFTRWCMRSEQRTWALGLIAWFCAPWTRCWRLWRPQCT